jgi:hypothetical protein
MEFIWIGKNYHPNDQKIFKTTKNYDASSLKMQKSFLRYLKLKDKKIIRISFYILNNLFFKINKLNFLKKHNNIEIFPGFLRFGYFTQLFVFITVLFSPYTYLKNIFDKKNNYIIFIYGMQSHLILQALIISKLVKKCKIIQIVPDLPEFMESNPRIIKKIMKYIDYKIIYFLINNFISNVVFFNPKMTSLFKIKRQINHITLPGLYYYNYIKPKGKKVDFINDIFNDKIIVIFSGKIDYDFGIKEFIDLAYSFRNNNKYLFVITGFGKSHLINKFRVNENSSNLIYLGFISNEMLLKYIYLKAHILVNFRIPDSNLNSYSFPSKIYDFLITGNYVLSTINNNLDNQISKFLLFVENLSNSELVSKIKSISFPNSNKRSQVKAVRKFIRTNYSKFWNFVNL